MIDSKLPTFTDIVDAASRLRGFAHTTPVLQSTTANELLRLRNINCYFKCENFQRIGAFKFRGAYAAMTQLSTTQKINGVICFSSGNHAQAVALSGKLLGIKTTIVMPHDSPELKVKATLSYGGNIIFYDRKLEDRDLIGRSLAEKHDLTLIHPYDNKYVISGQGTVAKELFEEVGELDYLFVCVGGGGLISGSSLSARALSPNCKVIGVEPEAGNDAQQSLKEGRIVHIKTPDTIADGAQTQHIGELTFEIMKTHVHEIITVSDRELIESMKFFAERMKIIVEPTGCLGFAGLLKYALSNPLAFKDDGARVGVIVSGGNVDLSRFAALIQSLDCK